MHTYATAVTAVIIAPRKADAAATMKTIAVNATRELARIISANSAETAAASA